LPVVSYKGRVVSGWEAGGALATGAFGQSADIGASGPVLRDLSSDDIWGWARSGRVIAGVFTSYEDSGPYQLGTNFFGHHPRTG
jgi:hypothetical protein